jgi:hypothetical protein
MRALLQYTTCENSSMSNLVVEHLSLVEYLSSKQPYNTPRRHSNMSKYERVGGSLSLDVCVCVCVGDGEGRGGEWSVSWNSWRHKAYSIRVISCIPARRSS